MRVVQMNAFSPPQKETVQINPIDKGNKNAKEASFNIRKLLDNFEKDDYILAGLLLVLIFEGCDDYILLAALGYLFIVGIM